MVEEAVILVIKIRVHVNLLIDSNNVEKNLMQVIYLSTRVPKNWAIVDDLNVIN